MTQAEAAALTIALEAMAGAALAPWLRRAAGLESDRPSRAMAALSCGLASALTHPVAWSANLALAERMPFAERATVIEIAVVAVEAFLCGLALRLRPTAALALSVACNSASFGSGLLLWWLRTSLSDGG